MRRRTLKADDSKSKRNWRKRDQITQDKMKAFGHQMTSAQRKKEHRGREKTLINHISDRGLIRQLCDS